MKLKMKRWQVEQLISNRLEDCAEFQTNKQRHAFTSTFLEGILPGDIKRFFKDLMLTESVIYSYSIEAAFNLGYKAGKNGTNYDDEVSEFEDKVTAVDQAIIDGVTLSQLFKRPSAPIDPRQVKAEILAFCGITG